MRRPNELPDALKNINVKAILRRRGIYSRFIQNKTLKEAALPLAKQMLTKKTYRDRNQS